MIMAPMIPDKDEWARLPGYEQNWMLFKELLYIGTKVGTLRGEVTALWLVVTALSGIIALLHFGAI